MCMEDCYGEFARHFEGEIIHIHCEFDSRWAESSEMTEVIACKITWDSFEHLIPKEVESSASCKSDSRPFWLICAE